MSSYYRGGIYTRSQTKVAAAYSPSRSRGRRYLNCLSSRRTRRVRYLQYCSHGSIYLRPSHSADDVKKRVEAEGRSCLLIPGDLMKDEDCKRTVDEHVKKYGRIDVLINNASKQIQCTDLGGSQGTIDSQPCILTNYVYSSRHRPRQCSLDVQVEHRWYDCSHQVRTASHEER